MKPATTVVVVRRFFVSRCTAEAMEPAQPREETGPGPQQGGGLRPGEAHHRGLLERGPDAVLVADPHGTILLANRRAAELVGHPSPEALTGRSILALVALSDPERARVTL